MTAFSTLRRSDFASDVGVDVVVQLVVNIEEILQAVVGVQAAVGGFGIGARLLERHQPGPGEGDVQFEPEIGLHGGIAQLIDFRIGEGIALALGERRRKQAEEEPTRRS